MGSGYAYGLWQDQRVHIVAPTYFNVAHLNFFTVLLPFLIFKRHWFFYSTE